MLRAAMSGFLAFDSAVWELGRSGTVCIGASFWNPVLREVSSFDSALERRSYEHSNWNLLVYSYRTRRPDTDFSTRFALHFG